MPRRLSADGSNRQKIGIIDSSYGAAAFWGGIRNLCTNMNHSAKIDETNCPVRFTIGLIGSKWKPVILYYLKRGPLRYGQLQKLIPHASQKVLTAQLKELEQDHIIERKEYSGRIRHVEYSFSRHGRSLSPVLEALSNWGAKYRAEHESEGKASDAAD